MQSNPLTPYEKAARFLVKLAVTNKLISFEPTDRLHLEALNREINAHEAASIPAAAAPSKPEVPAKETPKSDVKDPVKPDVPKPEQSK